MVKHFLGPGITYVLGTQGCTDKNGRHKPDQSLQWSKHLLRENIDAVEKKERASGLGSAGLVKVDPVKEKGRILQKKEIACAKTQNCARGGGEVKGKVPAKQLRLSGIRVA